MNVPVFQDKKFTAVTGIRVQFGKFIALQRPDFLVDILQIGAPMFPGTHCEKLFGIIIQCLVDIALFHCIIKLGAKRDRCSGVWCGAGCARQQKRCRKDKDKISDMHC